MWLLSSALAGHERGPLTPLERALRVAAGLVMLAPQMAYALPAAGLGIALILFHRIKGAGDGSPQPRGSTAA